MRRIWELRGRPRSRAVSSQALARVDQPRRVSKPPSHGTLAVTHVEREQAQEITEPPLIRPAAVGEIFRRVRTPTAPPTPREHRPRLRDDCLKPSPERPEGRVGVGSRYLLVHERNHPVTCGRAGVAKVRLIQKLVGSTGLEIVGRISGGGQAQTTARATHPAIDCRRERAGCAAQSLHREAGRGSLGVVTWRALHDEGDR